VSRISDLLARRGRRKLLVPFFTVGYPDFRTSLALIKAGIEAGSDIVELGMPFSDPMADGPDIQLSSHIALSRGTSLTSVFQAVQAMRKYSDTPLLLMGYYNPVVAMGTDRFVARATQAGANGLIIPDLPIDEAKELQRPAEAAGLSMVYLVSPTSSLERMKRIDRACTDLVYAVTVTGVTGGRSGYDRSTDNYLGGLRKQLSKPFVAGFGVSSPESARQLVRYADGVVIGSALIKRFRTARNRNSGIQRVKRLLASIRTALDKSS
jgi:tryptophan synthase alpha chain